MDPGNTEGETISASNPTVHPISANELSTTTLIVDNSRNGADYKGLAFGTNTHGNLLFATNFPAGNVDVFDQASKPKTPR